TLRSAVADTSTTRAIAEQDRARKEKELKAREAAIAVEQAKLAQMAERKGNTGAAEGQLTQILNEKRQLEAKLQDKEAEVLALQSKSKKNSRPRSIPVRQQWSSCRRSSMTPASSSTAGSARKVSFPKNCNP